MSIRIILHRVRPIIQKGKVSTAELNKDEEISAEHEILGGTLFPKRSLMTKSVVSELAGLVRN